MSVYCLAACTSCDCRLQYARCCLFNVAANLCDIFKYIKVQEADIYVSNI